MSGESTFDVVIVGAGPAGCGAALALEKSGLKVALIDKSEFPRDKICGDAIPGVAFKVLRSIDPKYTQSLFKMEEKSDVVSARMVGFQNQSLTLHWVLNSFNSKREDFDAALMDFVKETQTQIFLGQKITDVKASAEGVVVSTKNMTLRAQILIGADGANGICAKKLAGFQLDRNHHVGAVRAYVNGIKGLEPGVNEFFMSKNHVPGYFWIFPLNNGLANVGFGMLSKTISQRKANLKADMLEVIQENKELKDRFIYAEYKTEIQGFGLPVGSRFAPLSGDGFLLAGDAGSLIDPLKGHGIDNALWSGKLAADQVQKSFVSQNFSAEALSEYDKKVYAEMGNAFRKGYKALQLVERYPKLVNLGLHLARIGPLRKYLQKYA